VETGQPVRLLTPTQVPFVELVPGMTMARVLSASPITEFAGGYMRITGDTEYRDWTLTYDEVLYVSAGELEVIDETGHSTVAREGEAILIATGTTVTYRAKKGCESFYVVWPKGVAQAIEEGRRAGGATPH
jgi:ethanolamine utilization protein EutQ (cupin superfamily)